MPASLAHWSVLLLALLLGAGRLSSAPEPPSLEITRQEGGRIVLLVKGGANYAVAVEWSQDLQSWTLLQVQPPVSPDFSMRSGFEVGEDRFASGAAYFRIRYWDPNHAGTKVTEAKVYEKLPAVGTANAPAATKRKRTKSP